MEAKAPLFYDMKSVLALQNHWEELKGTHLRDLLKNEDRNNRQVMQLGDIFFDYTHQRMDPSTLELFKALVDETKLWEKIEAMFAGKVINKSEKRSVLHVALRAGKEDRKSVV